MRKQTRPQQPMSEVQLRTRFEEIEAAVLQSTTVNELYRSLDLLLDEEQWEPKELAAILEAAGPANILSLVLRGYESSDHRSRDISNRAILQLDRVLAAAKPSAEFVDQIWLAFAAQQAIILEHVEQDLDATLSGGARTDRARKTLGRVHRLLRERTGQTLRKLGVPLVAEPGVPLFVS